MALAEVQKEFNMAVDVRKDTTFTKVLSSWWDGTQTPKELALIAANKTASKTPFGAKEIVHELDTDLWYEYLESATANEQGWYNAGSKK